MGYYLVLKQNENVITATWTDLEIITLSKISQVEKCKYWQIVVLYVKSIKRKIQMS